MKRCDIKPCHNIGNCINDLNVLSGYKCICMSGFNGTHCEHQIGSCKSNTCLNQGLISIIILSENIHLHILGICTEVNETVFICNCTQGRTGIHCEHMINYCDNITCFNKGVCRQLLLNYKCECLHGTSGNHCEYIATSIIIRQYVAKTFAFIAILAVAIAIGFIVILDVLKYFFGIDITRKEREEIRRQRNLNYRKKTRKTSM